MKILSYGSLRKDQYNFERCQDLFGADSIKYIDTITLPNFALYSLGPYPAIRPSQETNADIQPLVVDILEVSPDCDSFIDRMELGANYRIEYVLINNITYKIYVYNNPLSEKQLVNSGDWIKYQENE
jgi:gamma-glutamylcyclotransferase (GGCT)/AIG2-like uncharacterized protein YtfP